MTSHPNIEGLVNMFFTQERFLGPRYMNFLDFRLTVPEAEEVSSRLRERGYDVMPYDFPKTIGIWKANDENEVPYRITVLKKGVEKLVENDGIMPYQEGRFTFETMKQVLSRMCRDGFESIVINKWGTTPRGALKQYNRTPADAVLDLVDFDPAFRDYRSGGKHPLNRYDFCNAQNIWKEKDGTPTQDARDAAKLLMLSVAEEKGINLYSNGKVGYIVPEKLSLLLPHLSVSAFKHHPINEWGTTLEFVLKMYGNSPINVVRDVIDSDPDFMHVRKYDLVKQSKKMYLQ